MSTQPNAQRTGVQRWLLGIVAGGVLVGVVLVALDWHQAEQVLKSAEWKWAGVALAFTALSYLAQSAGFAAASRIFDIQLKPGALLAIGFISSALSNLVSAAGVAAYSVRLLLMGRRGQRTADILAASILQSYLNTLAFLILLPFGLIHLLAIHRLSRQEEIGLAVVLGFVLLVLAVVSAFIFSQPARLTMSRIIISLGRRLSKRDFHASLSNLDATLARGGAALRQHHSWWLLLAALVLADWVANVIALGFCFEALGTTLPMGVLVTGFAIAMVVGQVSMVPGGLGVQDGSMVGVYVLLDVPLEQVVLASVLFRLVYYMIPFAVSLVFYWGSLRTPASPRA